MEKKYKILVVDDQIYIREIIKYTLEKNGFDVMAADCGCAAINMVKRLKPDLMLLDIMMPDMNGFEVLKHLKSDLDCNYIKVIMVTAKTQETDKQTAINLGADLYLTKPVNMNLLIEKICELLKINRANLANTHYNKSVELSLINRIRDAVKNNDKDFIENKLGMFISDKKYGSAVRCEAVIAVGSTKTKKYLKELLELLEDEDPMLREKAVWAVGELEEQRAYGKICAILRNQTETIDVKMAAVLTIKQLGKEEEVKDLLDGLKK